MTELRHVNFSYGGEKQVLRDFSLCLPENGTVCLLGASGCGKTTLLRLLAGLERPEAGQVLCPGRTALVFQEDRLLPWLTARQNVAAALHLPHDAAWRQAGEWLCALGLTGSEDALPGKLSGGMRQRVSLARALAFAPEVLLLDEPFRALDAATRAVCVQVLLQRGTQRLTVLVTHDPAEAALLRAERVLTLAGLPLRVQACETQVSVPFTK